jgi:hypothetical protein
MDGGKACDGVHHAATSCMLTNWYASFRRHTIKSSIIPLPKDFISYLLSDGIQLPTKSQPSAMGTRGFDNEGSDQWSESDTAAEIWEGSEAILELNEKIKMEIIRLGGHVFPKLNWSAPKDALWMNGSLKCSTDADVYLLLKSSDFIVHDLERMCTCQGLRAADDSADGTFSLVLRRWSNLHPSNEFRCFAAKRRIVAVCQRNCTVFFPHLPPQKERMGELIAMLFQDVIAPPRSKVPESSSSTDASGFSLDDFVFDVYIDKSERAWLTLTYHVCNTIQYCAV